MTDTDFPKIKQQFEYDGKKYIFEADLFCCETIDGVMHFSITDCEIKEVD